MKMVLQKQLSSQYLRSSQITVTILDVLSPVHYILKESPSLDGSSEAKDFLEAEEAMQKFYESVEPCYFKLPLKDTIIVALFKEKFYRAKVIRILTMSAGYLFKVYLVDYGIECSVSRECIYEIQNDFLNHPFQAVNFKLLGIEPISLIMNPVDLTMSYGLVTDWDPSAEIFIQDVQKGMCNAYIEVQAVKEDYIFGKLFICYENSATKCINNELISNKFAQFNEDCWENVQKIGSPLQNIKAKSRIPRTIKSLESQELDPKQVTSSPDVKQIFKMSFVSPTDGKVIAESSLMEYSATTEIEDRFHEEFRIQHSKSPSSSSTSGVISEEQNVQDSNSKSPLSSPASDAISEEQSFIQKRFLKLQQLHRKQLQSPGHVSDSDSTPVKSLSTDENSNKISLPTNICTVKMEQSSAELSSQNVGKSSICTKSISPCKSSISSDCNNLKSDNPDKTLSSSSCENQVALSSSSPEAIEVQTVGQQKFLKLQKLRKKQLLSPILQNNIENTSVKQLRSANESAVNLKQSSLVCTNESNRSSSEVCINQNEKKVDINVKPKELNSSSDNHNSNSSFQQEVLDASVSEDNLNPEAIEVQTVGQQKFLKLQKLRKKQLSSPILQNNIENTSVKLLPYANESGVNLNQSSVICTNKMNSSSNEMMCINQNGKKIDINVKPKELNSSSDNHNSNSSFQKEVLDASVSEDNSKQESMTEVQLNAFKRLQKLQELHRKKSPKYPIGSNSPNTKSSSIDSNECQKEANIMNTSIESSGKKDASSHSPTSLTGVNSSMSKSLCIEASESLNKANSVLLNELSQRKDNTSSSIPHLSSDCPKSSSPSNSVETTSEGRSKQENTSEVVLENVKTFQRLQNRARMKKMKQNIQADEPADLPKVQVTIKDKCVDESQSDKSKLTCSNQDQIHCSSSSKNPLEKISNLNQISVNKVSEIESPGFKTTQVLNDKQEKSQKKTCSSANKVERLTNITSETSRKNINKNHKSPKSNNSENGLSSELSPDDTGSSIISQLLNASDSDNLLSNLSKKNDKISKEISDDMDVMDSFVELSTQLQSSGKKPSDFNLMSLWERQKVPVLQIGTGTLTPVLSIDEAEFSKHLNRVLKEIKFYGPSCMQSAVWPAMYKNQSMIIIAPPHSGKTISYVLPLVSFLTAGDMSLLKKNGPSIIILCSSWVKAQAVNDFFHLFLQDTKVKITTLCTYGGNYKEKVLPHINNCNILIATPYCLLSFLKTKCIRLVECEHFILDDGTALMSKNKMELKNIFLYLMDCVKNHHNFPQMVLCANRWDKNFQIIKDKLMLNPKLFFTSFLESAIYAKIPIFVHVCDTMDKQSSLLNVLNESHKVVICTTSLEDAEDLHHFLRYADARSFLVNEEMEHYIAEEVINDWKSTRNTTSSHCLVITDAALIKMTISNAECLIHYDVPSESRLQFGNRFSCIAGNFQNEKINPKCVCHIFIDEFEYCHASQLVEIVENSGGTPSEKLKKIAQKRNQNENTSGSLCHYMKAFGFCKSPHCKHRHYIDSEIDKPQVVPFEGDIQAVVTHVIDASHYYVRLLKYLDPICNKTVSLVATYAKIGFQLMDFYKHASDELIEDSPIVGGCYILAEANNLFYRVKVLEFMPSSEKLPEWKILFLDEGWVKFYNKLKLYKISDQINLPAPLVLEVYACKIMTLDSCYVWNPQTTSLVEDLIGGKEIYGKIILCIKDVLWLDPIALRLQLSNANEYVNLFKLDQKLLECGHARRNKNHLVSLKRACENKIPFPNLTKSVVKKEVAPKPEPSVNYAFLDCDTFEDVYVSSVISPHQIYVQRAKFVECLDELLVRINNQIEKRTLKKAYAVHKGMHCIAPFEEDNRYYRAVITDVINEVVQLFYVDFGDSGIASRSDIYCLSEEFLLLPFQAIECELAGIAAAHGGWTDSAASALITLTRDDAGDMKILQLKAYNKSMCYEGGNHYVIDLWFNEKNLSEHLLQAGFGIPADIPIISSPKMADDISPNQSNDEAFDLSNQYLTSTDDEMDLEDKVASAAFYDVLEKMMIKEYNLIANPHATITEVSSDEEEILKSLKKPTLPISSEVSNKFEHLFPKLNQIDNCPVSPEACSNSVKPLITWWDTPEELNILISVKEAKVYHLDITDEEINFNTIIAGKQYSTAEKLYAGIISSCARTYQNAQGINIVVKKATPFKWPRLTKDKRKFLHIKYDLVHLDDSDTEEQPAATQTLNMPSSCVIEENSSSTDEDEDFVQSWKDFAQSFNPQDLMN